MRPSPYSGVSSTIHLKAVAILTRLRLQFWGSQQLFVIAIQSFVFGSAIDSSNDFVMLLNIFITSTIVCVTSWMNVMNTIEDNVQLCFTPQFLFITEELLIQINKK